MPYARRGYIVHLTRVVASSLQKVELDNRVELRGSFRAVSVPPPPSEHSSLYEQPQIRLILSSLLGTSPILTES